MCIYWMLACLCLVEWNSIKRFTQAVLFLWDFNKKVLKQFACFSFSISTHEKFSHLLWLKRPCVVRNFYPFFSLCVSQEEQLNSISHCQVKQGLGHRKIDEGWVRSAEMVKQAVYAVLSHAFNSINPPWMAGSWIGFQFDMAECSLYSLST